MTNDEETKYYTCKSSRNSKKVLNIFKVESPHIAYYWDRRSKKWERSSSIGEIMGFESSNYDYEEITEEQAMAFQQKLK